MSFVLSADSPLIGAGTVIEDDCTTDFFGNKITSNNIGCYGGDGADVEYEKEGLFKRILRFFKNVLETLYHEIYVIFD